MLVIQRRVGERIVMSSGIEITVAALTKRGVRLALRVPDDVTVLRGEILDAVAAANAASATSSIEEPDAALTVHEAPQNATSQQRPGDDP